MRRIRWTVDASDQMIAAIERIQADSPTAARKVAQVLIVRIERLANLPGLGRLGEIEGTRELVSPPYVVVYRSTDEMVEIPHIWHGAQDWR